VKYELGFISQKTTFFIVTAVENRKSYILMYGLKGTKHMPKRISKIADTMLTISDEAAEVGGEVEEDGMGGERRRRGGDDES
jgi:hypothetical protein